MSDEPKHAVLVAIAAASGAIVNMVEIVRDRDLDAVEDVGTALNSVEVVENLADALQSALLVEHASATDERQEMLGQLQAAIGRFLEGWV